MNEPNPTLYKMNKWLAVLLLLVGAGLVTAAVPMAITGWFPLDYSNEAFQGASKSEQRPSLIKLGFALLVLGVGAKAGWDLWQDHQGPESRR